MLLEAKFFIYSRSIWKISDSIAGCGAVERNPAIPAVTLNQCKFIDLCYGHGYDS